MRCAMQSTFRALVGPPALALLSLLTSVGSAHAEPFGASVVKVRAIGTDGTTKFGSGVVIGAERIATACHLTRHATTIEIVHGTSRWVAKGQVGSLTHDLCALNASTVDIPIAWVRPSSDLKAGERVIAAGVQRGGRELMIDSGIVAALYSYGNGQVIRTTASFDFGSSGGGLFDEAGNLVGLLAFKARSGEHLRFALPSEWTSPVVGIAREFTTIQPTSIQTAFWERPQGDRPSFLGGALREAATQQTKRRGKSPPRSSGARRLAIGPTLINKALVVPGLFLVS